MADTNISTEHDDSIEGIATLEFESLFGTDREPDWRRYAVADRPVFRWAWAICSRTKPELVEFIGKTEAAPLPSWRSFRRPSRPDDLEF